MKQWALIPAFILLLSACASTHPGSVAKLSGDRIDGLKISAEGLGNPKAEAYEMVAITLENTSDEWLRIEKAEVLIDEEAAKTVSVVVGKDLVDWADAMKAQGKVNQHNNDMAQMGLAALGAVAAVAGASTNNRNLAIGGVATMGAATAWAATDSVRNSLNAANNPNAVPQDHICSPFAVPGKMFLRRWLLLNKPVGKVVSVVPIALTLVDGRRVVVNLTPYERVY